MLLYMTAELAQVQAAGLKNMQASLLTCCRACCACAAPCAPTPAWLPHGK